MFKIKSYSTKLISIVLTVMMLLSMVVVSGTAVSAGAASTSTIYFQPTSDWTQANARFVAYLFQNGKTEQWVSLTKGSSGYYEGDIPTGYTNIIFVRMNPSYSANDWNGKWNQSADLTIPSGKNLFTLQATSDWNNGSGTWSTYTPPTQPPTDPPTQTPTTATETPTTATETPTTATETPTTAEKDYYLGDITSSNIDSLGDYKSNKVGSYNEYYPYKYWNWTDSDTTYYYEANGKIFATVADESNKKMSIYAIDINNSTTTLQKTISWSDSDMNRFGGFLHGSDGNFYVVVGQSNTEQNDNKVVIQVMKYSSSWAKLGTCDILGSASNYTKGIRVPFDAGNCQMDLSNGVLALHTSREMYEIDGVCHQGNISFYIDTATMKAKPQSEVAIPYSSHSFNQYVKYDGSKIAFIDHGDAYPRSIYLTVINGMSGKTKDLFAFNDSNIGANYTGTTVNGFELSSNNYVVVGSSIPHEEAVQGVTGHTSEYNHNIYLALASRTDLTPKFIWLTQNDPTDVTKEVSEPRLIKLSDDRFVVMYASYTCNSTGSTITATDLVCKIIDGDGNIISSKVYSGVNYNPISQPIYASSKLIWTNSYSSTNTKLFTIPVTNSKETPTEPETEPATEDREYTLGWLDSNSVTYMKDYPSGKTGSYNQYYGSYWNYAAADTTYYYEEDGQLYAVVIDKASKVMHVYSLDLENNTVKLLYDISLDYSDFALDSVGGFCVGDDDCFYVALGQNNSDNNNAVEVIRILQFDADWNELNYYSIYGNESDDPSADSTDKDGISVPFRAGADMIVKDGVLILHTSRKIYAGAQTNVTFYINVKSDDWVLMEGQSPYVSNSYRQLVKADGENTVLVDHGNAIPRAVTLNVIDEYDVMRNVDVFAISGEFGDNFTGTTVTGLEISRNYYMVVGSSMPHNNAVQGITGADKTYKHNIYLTLTAKNNLSTKFVWITDNDPTDVTKEVSEPRIVKITDNIFAVMYAEYQYNAEGTTLEKTNMVCKTIDGNGNVLETRTYEDVRYNPICQPIYFDSKIVWTNTYNTKETMLYAINITDGITEKPTEPPTEEPTEEATEAPTTENPTSSTEVPTQNPTTNDKTDGYYVTGDINLKLSACGTNKVRGNIVLQAGTYKIKLNNNGEILGYGKTVNDTSNGMTFKATYNSFVTLNATGGVYTFQVNVDKNTLVIKRDSNIPVNYLTGDINTILSPVEGRTLAIGTTYLEAGTYNFKLSIDKVAFGYGKTVNDKTTGSLSFKSTYNSSVTLVATGGNYTFTLDTSKNQLRINYTPVKDEALDDVHLSGDINLVLDDNGGSNDIATATITLTEGTYSFKVYNYGQAVTSGVKIDDFGTKKLYGNYNTPVTLLAIGGTYTFTFNKTTNELTVARA